MTASGNKSQGAMVWLLGIIGRIRRETMGMDAELSRVEERIYAGEVSWTGRAPFAPGPGRGKKPPRG